MSKVKPLCVDACAWYPHSPELEKKLARVDRFDEPYTMATLGKKGLIGVPREMCDYPWRNTSLDQRVWGHSMMSQHGGCKFKERNKEQVRVINESVSLLRVASSHVVEASTGFGKTFCAINIAEMMGRKTLIVVNKEDQLASWTQEIKKFFAVPDEEVGILQQNKCQIEGRSYVIAMVHSLAQREYDFDLSEFGLIIFDEVHHMSAETFSRVAAMFPAMLRLGFSATTKRSDGKEGLFQAHIGRVLVKAKLLPMPPKILVKYTGWVLPKVLRRDSHGNMMRIQIPHEAGKLMHVITAMAQNQERNEMIVNIAVQAYKKGRWVVVMSELAEAKHLGILREMCKRKGVPDEDMGYYKGGMKQAALEVTKTKHLAFATFNMTGEATDVPWWDCLIMATPRAQVVQAVGRVCREHPGKPKPVVVDLVDTDSDILEGYFKARLKQYTSSEMKGEVIYL